MCWLGPKCAGYTCTHSCACKQGEQQVMGLGRRAGCATRDAEEGMLWCVSTHVFWMPRTAGPYPRGANMNMCPYMCTYACTALGMACQALLSVSCEMEPTLCITPGPVPGEGRSPKLLDARGLLPAGCLQPGLTTKPTGPHPGAPTEKQGLPTATPQDTRHHRPLLTPPQQQRTSRLQHSSLAWTKGMTQPRTKPGLSQPFADIRN